MPFATTPDNVRLHYEEAGSGTPLLFVHEFAGDHRAWEPQMRYFARRYRCITYSARGYTPSDVPPTPDVLRLREIPRRRDRDAGSSEDRQGAYRAACRWAATRRSAPASSIRSARSR